MLEGVRLPKGTFVKLGGKIEEARETQRRLGTAIAAALTLVVGLLYLRREGLSLRSLDRIGEGER